MYRNIINKIAVLIVLFVTSKTGVGQDIHFSQYAETPVVINPALITTAFDTRAIINYKSQWGSVAKAYTTFGFTFEQAINHQKLKKNYFGIALSMYRDVAGDAKLGSLMPNLGFNYITKVSEFGKLSGGLQAGVIYRTIDVSKLQWDNQFDGYAYDPSRAHGEATPRSGIVGFDMGGGVNFHYAKSERYISSQDGAKFDIGFSAFHYEVPPNSFWLSSEKLYTKTIGYASGEFGIPAAGMVLIPSVIYQRQGPSTEINAGFMFRYIIEEQGTYTSLKKGSSLTFGAYYRVNDALIPTLLYQNGTYAIGISYDFNLSDLTPASKTKGGLEISLRYNVSPGYGKSLGASVNKPTK
jgi:type IX secretion system PorP/SprF family membrane protein